VAVEALTELATTADIFDVPRAKLMALHPFLEGVLGCGYCTSVWMAAPFGWALPGTTGYLIVDITIKTFALHRAANLLHEFKMSYLTNGVQINNIVHKVENDGEMWK
jgi:hypothetical protein